MYSAAYLAMLSVSGSPSNPNGDKRILRINLLTLCGVLFKTLAVKVNIEVLEL